MTNPRGEALERIPEYFAKPGITEALAKSHPVLLVRQMANEILSLRSATAPQPASAPQSRAQMSKEYWIQRATNAEHELALRSEGQR